MQADQASNLYRLWIRMERDPLRAEAFSLEGEDPIRPRMEPHLEGESKMKPMKVELPWGEYRSLDLAPVNITPETLLSRLSRGETVMVRLEPGDATRYDFFIIPLIEDNVPTRAREGWIGVVPVNLSTGQESIAYLDPLREANRFDFADILVVPYTQVVYAGFFNLLIEALRP